MIQNYLKTALRSFAKNKAYVFINTIGLGLAIACCITAYINYDFATEFDKSMQDKEHIFRINSEREFQGEITKYGIAPLPMANQIKQNIPDVDQIIRYDSKGSNFKIEDDVFSSSLAYSDPEFFEMFSFELIYGDQKGLKEPGNIYISDVLSYKYFGTTASVGKQITLVLPDRTMEFVVGGVFKKLKLNSSFRFNAITHIDNYFRRYRDLNENDWTVPISLFLKINNLSQVKNIEYGLQEYREIQNQSRDDFKVSRYYLDPFKGMAVRAEDEQIRKHGLNRAQPKASVVAPWIMAIVLLLIACFNFTNTSIAVSSRRLKEIGIRKVLGSQKKQLIFQFLTENIIVCCLGLFTGLIIAEFLVPTYSNMWWFLELDINYTENLGFFGFLIVLLLATAIFSGGYPAFYISGFQPTLILKGSTKLSGTNIFTRTLLVIQYTSCIIALIMGFSFVENAKYQQEMDLGYETHGILFHGLNSGEEYQKLRNALINHPDIIQIVGTQHHLFSRWFSEPVEYNTEEAETDIMNISHDYLNIMGLDIEEGRNFIENSESDMLESIIVNREFIRTFGIEKAIGKKIVWRDSTQLFIAGIVNDFYTRAYYGPVSPMMFRYIKPEEYRHIVVKSDPANIARINDFVKKEYRQLFPNYLFRGELMDERLKSSATNNINIVKMFFFLAIVALVLTTIGLYSLVSLNIIKRKKEIGIRKVLGASVAHIMYKLNKEFVIILTLSSIAGIPLAVNSTLFLMDLIWDQFLGPSILAVAVSILVIFLVSGITLGSKVIKAAMANPVEDLRTE